MATTATQQSNMTTMDVVNQTIIRSLEDLPLMSDYELEQVQRALQEQEQLFQIEITLMERHLMSTIGSIPADKGTNTMINIFVTYYDYYYDQIDQKKVFVIDNILKQFYLHPTNRLFKSMQMELLYNNSR